MRQSFTLFMAILLTFSGLRQVQGQGSLTPPAGAPAPVFKTLTEVEPRTSVQTLPGAADASYLISRPGSYYLVANVNGTADKHGIRITTRSVTLDLNGFEVAGVPGSKTGIFCSGANLTVRNGIVREWGEGGLNVSSESSFENIKVRSNTGHGIKCGTEARLEGVLSRGNSGDGVNGSSLGVALNCMFLGNGGNGYFTQGGSVINNCTMSQNAAAGIVINAASGVISHSVFSFNGTMGINQSNGSGWTIVNNSIVINAQDGMRLLSANLVLNNILRTNGPSATAPLGVGIYLGSGSNHVEGNHIVASRYGIFAVTSPGKDVVIRNTVIGSTTANYTGNTGSNAATFGAISTNAATNTNPNANFSF